MYWTLLRKLMYRPRAGTLRVKWLEDLGAATRFAERNIGKCHKTAVE